MSTTTVSTSDCAPLSPTSSAPSRPSRLRRLSQLRTLTQNHLSGHHSSGHRSYRNSLTRAVGLSLSPQRSPTSDTPPDLPRHDLEHTISIQSAPEQRRCPETDGAPLSTVTTNPSIDSGGGSSGSEQSHASSSASSRSTPSNDPETAPPTTMVQHGSSLVPEINAVGLNSTSQSRIPCQEEPSSAMDTNQAGLSRPADSMDRVMTQVASPTEHQKPPQKATIRFYAYQDPHQNSRPSLPFAPMTRTLPCDSAIIKVGRYSERDGIPITNPSEPSDAPAGFKSKVVSRKHCEFSFVNGQWHIRDVGSSSGTFLNHMRLSQPNMASRLYAVRDGDIVQLGIDFKGGEEMIFRCVRIRIECNRTWQQRPNEFNKNTESLIRNLGKGNHADYSGSRECSICLGSVLRPYQCLFMAACAHVWHYKCIRRLIHTPEYPMFQCPNCRAYTDLSAEVDDSNDAYEEEATTEPPNARDQPVSECPINATPPRDGGPPVNEAEPPADRSRQPNVDQLTAATNSLALERTPSPNRTGTTLQAASTEATDGIPRSPNINIPSRSPPDEGSRLTQNRVSAIASDTLQASTMFEDNPMTPRNDLGPLAFDGRAGRL
ncbi:hypothetical protein AJ80_00693 [Polytolypa hystricis UAMH7299]|uniref:FHA domain-containing protein n=1 Tax=Polytolypa hystricis (strain UAMH7299) TaxID=1447883 RepID=A0A2B7Z3H6_POLH7|nr:hypothetical protein AJ80_00693 [Polytolypa hystricis UAMH7299]